MQRYYDVRLFVNADRELTAAEQNALIDRVERWAVGVEQQGAGVQVEYGGGWVDADAAGLPLHVTGWRRLVLRLAYWLGDKAGGL